MGSSWSDVPLPRDWRRRKRTVLRRDGHRCQVPRDDMPDVCGARATEVDHVVPRSRGGGHALGNLRAICTPHHRAKTAREASQAGGWHGRKRPPPKHPGMRVPDAYPAQSDAYPPDDGSHPRPTIGTPVSDDATPYADDEPAAEHDHARPLEPDDDAKPDATAFGTDPDDASTDDDVDDTKPGNRPMHGSDDVTPTEKAGAADGGDTTSTDAATAASMDDEGYGERG